MKEVIKAVQGHTCHFGHVLRQARLQKGVNQSSLARRLGVVQQTVSRIETGKQACSPDLVVGFANVLGMPDLVDTYCDTCPVKCSRGVA